jgi:hypothetical protein
VTTYTYDPSGNPTVSGTANDWPFQYQGMEKEFTDPAPYYYSGSGQFYSPQLVRSLSETGQTSGSGPGGGFSPSGMAIAPPSGSSGGLSGQSVLNDSQQAFQVGEDVYNTANQLGITYNEIPIALPLAIIGGVVDFVVNFFEDIFGGSDHPQIPRQLLHGRHPLYPVMLGVSDGLIPTEASAGKPEFCGDLSVCNKRPLPKDKNVTKDPAAIFNDCIHENLMTGEGSVPFALCLTLTGGCVATSGAAPVCLVGAGMCLYDIGVEAYCTSKALHDNPPPLPPVPVPDTKGLPGFE